MTSSLNSFFTPAAMKDLVLGVGIVAPISTWSGITPASTAALGNTLRKDYEKWHIFYDDGNSCHNHLAHHLICIWALGATAARVNAVYEYSLKFMRHTVPTVEAITTENFHSHIGDPNFYAAYKDFFKVEVGKRDIVGAVEIWIFSSDMNHDEGKGNAQMLTRLMSRIMHPCIRLGYGLEFGIPVMITEALAETAVHRLDAASVVPDTLFSTDITSKYSPGAPGLHAFRIVSQILRDGRFGNAQPVSHEDSVQGYSTGPSPLLTYLEQWTFDASNLRVLQQKVKELQWTATLLYVSGKKDTKAGDPFWADFITMHFVTSAVFVPSFVAALSPRARYLLMSRLFGTILMWWWSRGCPILDIKVAETPWDDLIQPAIQHPDVHLPNTIRALSQFSQIYGNTTAGTAEFKELSIPNSDLLDGSFFHRAAVLTLARVLEGEQDESFRYAPGTRFYWDRD